MRGIGCDVSAVVVAVAFAVVVVAVVVIPVLCCCRRCRPLMVLVVPDAIRTCGSIV